MADFNAQRLAQALAGPRDGKLTPPDEQAYQSFMAFDPNVRAWSNGFQNRYGEQPNTTDNANYDYRKAFMAGAVPQSYEGDGGAYHWDSRGKAPDHPTEWMNDFLQKTGADPMMLQPQQVTPEMQQFMQQQLPTMGSSPPLGQIDPNNPANTGLFAALRSMGN